jgi:hypothetical protein
MGKKDAEVEPVPTRWDTLLLVCRKCIRKRDGAADELRRGLRRALRDLGVPDRHRIRVVETGCLDVCPKEGVTAARIGRGPAGAVVVVPPPFDPEAAVKALFPKTPAS